MPEDGVGDNRKESLAYRQTKPFKQSNIKLYASSKEMVKKI